MKPHKSVGPSAYGIDMFRYANRSLLQCLTLLFNACNKHGLPTAWNSSLLLPLFKHKGSKTDCKNYRPICLMHPLLKAYSKCILGKLDDFLDDNDLRQPF